MPQDVFPKHKKTDKMRKVLREFAGNTTAHGWGNVIRNTSKFGKAAWIFISTICSIVAFVLIVLVVVRYCQFETRDSIKVTKGEAIFPSVTVCPLTPTSVKGKRTFFTEAAMNDSNTFSISAYVGLSLLLQQYHLKIYDIQTASKEVQLLYNKSYERINSNGGYYENFLLSERMRYTIQQRDFIPSCKFKGEACTEELYQSGHHEHFNCFTFNGPLSNISQEEVDDGPTKGLSLILYLDADLGMGTFYDPDYPTGGSQGVRVMIHEQGTLPDPENDGFDTKAGNSINVALSSNRRELMTPPWGECAEHNDIKYNKWKYSPKACALICKQKMVFKKCGCILGSLPVDEQTKDAKFCADVDALEWQKNNPNVTLLRKVLDRLECSIQEFPWGDIFSQEGCECKENCIYDTYDITLSESEWPMKGVEYFFYCEMVMNLINYNENSSIYQTFHQRIAPQCLNLSTNNEGISLLNAEIGDDMREQFLRLNVYFKDDKTRITTQSADFTFGSMISEIGGNLGLLVGMSVISISEIFVLCFGIVKMLICKSKTQTKVESFKVDKLEYP